MDTITESLKFCDRQFTSQEVSLIREVVQSCKGLSRMELANTVCELLDWQRPNGKLKARECRDLLERLENMGEIKLPGKKTTKTKGAAKCIVIPEPEKPLCVLTGKVDEYLPLQVQLVETKEQRLLFRDLVGRYHYLGYSMPYGARLQYLVYVERGAKEVVGCVQFSSPAWWIKVRDEWIGWNNESRKLRLQHVVNNSRFLVLARIENLASKMLSEVMRHLRKDWQTHYAVEPWLVETMVDRQRFHGGCYRAANFEEIGQTTGRGRMDRTHQRQGAEIKTVLVYPLVKHAKRKLSQGW
jgi:hypothetical protein